MTTSIAKYYIDEIDDWKSVVDDYMEEMQKTEDWLQQIPRLYPTSQSNTRAEHLLNYIYLSRQNFIKLLFNLQLFEKCLYHNKKPVGNEIITNCIRQRFIELRKVMQGLEKEYLNIRYDCDRFLSETVTSQYKPVFGKFRPSDN